LFSYYKEELPFFIKVSVKKITSDNVRVYAMWRNDTIFLIIAPYGRGLSRAAYSVLSDVIKIFIPLIKKLFRAIFYSN